MHILSKMGSKQDIARQVQNGLLNRRRGITATAGSNPALSAIFSQYIVLQKGFWSLTSVFATNVSVPFMRADE